MIKHETVDSLLASWDNGESIWTIEMGGLGPGYEQAIQVAAVEFARAGKDMPRTDSLTNDAKLFDAICSKTLEPIDDALGGLSGAQFGAAKWLAWQWCFNGGPAKLVERAKAEGEGRRAILCSNFWPRTQA